MPYVKYKSQDGTKPVFKLGLDLFKRVLAAGLMCAIVYVSTNSLFLAFGSHTTGYTLQTKDADGTFKTVEIVEFENGEEIYPEIDKETSRIIPTEEMTDGAKKGFEIFSQCLMFALFCVLLYTELWSCGDADRNLVQFNRISADKLKGFKGGAIAVIPYMLSYLLAIFSEICAIPLQFKSTFAFINIPFKPIIDFALGNGFVWYDALVLLLPAVAVALYCGAAYLIGFKQLFISEKILYTEK